MAMYKNLRRYSDQKAAWISQRLIDLRQTIRASDLGNRRDDNLVIGSWNIRAFDEGAPRRDESFHYIAEIIDHFDICAVQEVKKALAPMVNAKPSYLIKTKSGFVISLVKSF